MQKAQLIIELEAFLVKLKEHQKSFESFINSDYGSGVNRSQIKDEESKLCRMFGKIETYIRKYSGLVIYEPTTRTKQDPWINGLTEELSIRKGPALEMIIKETNRIIGKIEAESKEEILLEDINLLFDSIKLHPDIVRVSKSTFNSAHYPEAVLNAYKEVIVKVREISELRELDGVALMQQAFSVNNPKIKLNKLETPSDKDEQAGYMNLFIGAALGIRNPKAHDNIKLDDPYRALSLIDFASMLLYKLDARIK